MHPKWLIALGMAFLACSILSGILEQQYMAKGEQGVIWQTMSSFHSIDMGNPLSAVYGLIIGTWNLIKGVFQIMIWDYSYFTGTWVIIRYFLMTISFGIIISLLLSLRGVSSG